MRVKVQGNACRVADMNEGHVCLGGKDLEGGVVQEVFGWLKEA